MRVYLLNLRRELYCGCLRVVRTGDYSLFTSRNASQVQQRSYTDLRFL